MTRFTSLRFLAWLLPIVIIPFLVNSCKPDSTITSTGPSSGGGGGTVQKSTVSGQVINKNTGIPIDSALVHIFNSTFNISVYTNSQGKYSNEFELSGNTTLTIITSKVNFKSDTTSFNLSPLANYSVSVISLSPLSSGTKPSGDPVSIYLLSQSVPSIGVKGSGAQETANLVFQVVDSSGTPIDLAHSVNVKFLTGSAPGGGELISPTVVQTNNLGQATVNITSGTKSGVVQITAQIDLANKTLKSTPVSIAIHGGLPDLNHFSIIPSQVNFAGYDIFGNTMGVSVVVGDKYSNPVKPQTVVYFNTTGGTIGGSIQTDDAGKGGVLLTSGNPKPTDVNLGPGFATVTASTADENQQSISRSTVILFSGYPNITINPTTFNIPNSGTQNFDYTVKDENGNPLAGGTNISVTVEGENVKSQGDLNVLLPDTQTGWTDFSFSVYDADDSTNVAKPITITVKATGPNGTASKQIKGTSH